MNASSKEWDKPAAGPTRGSWKHIESLIIKGEHQYIWRLIYHVVPHGDMGQGAKIITKKPNEQEWHLSQNLPYAFDDNLPLVIKLFKNGIKKLDPTAKFTEGDTDPGVPIIPG